MVTVRGGKRSGLGYDMEDGQRDLQLVGWGGKE